MERKAGKQITITEMIEDCEKENPELIKYKEERRKINKCPGGSDLFGE